MRFRFNSLLAAAFLAFATLTAVPSFADELPTDHAHVVPAIAEPSVVEPATPTPVVIQEASGLGFLRGVTLVPQAWADEAPVPPSLEVPDEDLGTLIGKLFSYKTLGPIGLAMVIIMIAMQILKSWAGSFRFKKPAVILLAVLYAICGLVSGGMTWLHAIATVLLGAGGAMKLFDSIKSEVSAKKA